jgi:hypothetical protein
MPVALEKGHDNPYVRACFRRTLPLRYTSKRQFVQSFTSDLRHSTALAFQSTQDRAKSVIPLEKNMVEIPKSKVCGPVSSGAKRKNASAAWRNLPYVTPDRKPEKRGDRSSCESPNKY